VEQENAAVSSEVELKDPARYSLAQPLPTRPGQFPWTTFAANLLGCLLIGVLTVLITEVFSARRLVRPFLGVGVLGGFTTFSTYAVDIRGRSPTPRAIASRVNSTVSCCPAVFQSSSW
jgi:protein CrcB